MRKTAFASTKMGKTTIALAVATALLGSASAAQARSGGLLDFLFGGGQSAPERVVVTAPADFSRDMIITPERPVVKRKKAVAAPVVKAVPLPEVTAFTDPADQILHDPSLRRGDVVMFPTGAKVFVGKASRQAPWTLADFEEIGATKALSNKARAEAVAVTSNSGAGQALVVEASIAPAPLKVASADIAPLN